MNESIADLIDFTPTTSSPPHVIEDNFIQIKDNDDEKDEEDSKDANTTISSDINETEPPKKTQQEELMDIAKEVIDILFKDQYNNGFASVHIKDHYEVISLASNRFKNLLTKKYHNKFIASQCPVWKNAVSIIIASSRIWWRFVL